jgi:hypothetical protein
MHETKMALSLDASKTNLSGIPLLESLSRGFGLVHIPRIEAWPAILGLNLFRQAK